MCILQCQNKATWEDLASSFNKIKYFAIEQIIVIYWHKFSLSVYLFAG